MPTQEERLTALEQAFATFQKDTAEYIQQTDENITIMLGVIRHQGQDIRRIFQHLEKIDERLEAMDEHLNSIEQRLNRLETIFDAHTALLNEHTRVLSEHTGRFDRLEALLTQILERLPKNP